GRSPAGVCAAAVAGVALVAGRGTAAVCAPLGRGRPTRASASATDVIEKPTVRTYPENTVMGVPSPRSGVLRGIRDTTMCAREPIRQAAERFVGGGIVDRHRGGGAAVSVEDLGAPAVRGELRHLDPVLAAIDLLNDALGGRSQRRQSLTKTKRNSSVTSERIKR